MASRRYLTYWGKAQPYLAWTQLWHPVAYHCLDVAAVAERLLADRPDLLVRLSDRLRMPWTDLAEGIVFLMAIHDVGKFAEVFQCSIPSDRRDPSSPCREIGGGSAHHTHLLNGMLRIGRGRMDPCSWTLFEGWSRNEAVEVLKPISGHHGQPPLEKRKGVEVSKGVDPEDLKNGLSYLSADARDDIGEFLQDLDAILPVRPWPIMDAAGRAALSLGLSGFAVLCDWMGSSKDWFPYQAPGIALQDYWRDVARPRADEGVMCAGVTRTRFSPSTGLANVFPGIARPRPMQAAADGISMPAESCLAIIEDVTGSGKTEAAITLAHRMVASGKGDGIFLGLPTMATSDAMYGRVTRAAANIYPPGSTPDIVLSHGGSTRKRRAALDARRDRDEDGSVGDYVESWLASDKRSALLADFGVGTIDQALLAVLGARYQGLRLYGLAGKIIILDEVHSYDRYMFEEIKALLGFHAFLGGSAIVMSATLSLSDRAQIARAFQDGLRKDAVDSRPRGRAKAPPSPSGQEVTSSDYPAIHLVTGAGVRSCEVAAYEGLRRRVTVDLSHSWDEAEARVQACLSDGGCACVVRSTVDEAIETHDRLAAIGLSPTLLHARFTAEDRAAAQDAVMRRYGPDEASWQGRKGGLVVATQVIEQSLDLDFDLLVTDVAPIELIVQRAGRVARHVEVRKRLGLPYDRASLVMVVPDPDVVDGSDWLDRLVQGAGVVYPDHGKLWRAASALKRSGGFEVPAGVRNLVEECATDAGLPHQLIRRSDVARGDEQALGGVGRTAVLDPRAGYAATGPWLDDAKAQTRVGSMRRSLRLGIARGDRVLPLPRADGGFGSWQESTVDVSAARAACALNAPANAKAVQDAIAGWSRHEREELLVVCEPGPPGRWSGRVLDAKGRPRSFRYDRARGLEWRAMAS